MKRPERTHTKPRNEQPPVPEIQGKAKHGKSGVKTVVTNAKTKSRTKEQPIADVYAVIDNDLARDNLENDMTEADKQNM